MTEQRHYSSDAPLTNPELDRFLRWPFAKRVAEVIAGRSDPSSIVIGLYGAWGNGKTTVLNFIEKALEEDEQVICMKFNPWRYGTEEQILEGFFLDMAEAIDKKIVTTKDKIKDVIKKVAPVAGELTGLESVGGGVAQFFNGPTLTDLRNRIESALEEAKKRVLVLADDIDRLEKNEIHTTFRLVKLTADFKYTAYILAFDKEVVASALQERYGAGSEEAGRAFLEKIIQVPLNLPSIDSKVIKNFCFEGVDQALNLAKIELNEQQVQEFVRDFTVGFDKRIRTPRKAKLYGNILMFSLPILKGEVNPVDLMLIEGIRVFFPKLYEAIKNNQNKFLGTFDRVYSGVEESKKEIKVFIDKFIDSTDVEEIAGIKSLLQSLFPQLEAVYSNMNYGSEWEETWAKSQRICSSAYFKRYFSYAVPQDDMPDQEIVRLIDLASEESEDKVSKVLEQQVTVYNAGVLIRKLRVKTSIIPQKPSKVLAISIAKNASKYPNPSTLYDFTNPFPQAAMLINDLVQNVTSNSEREALAIQCIENASDLEFALEIFRWLRREREDRPEKVAFNEKEISRIGLKLVEIIERKIGDQVDITSKYEKSCGYILYLLKKYRGEDNVASYLNNLFTGHPKAVIRLLDSFTPTSWGMESGVAHKSDFEREQYNNIVSIVDPEIIISAIKSDLGRIPEIPKEYPRLDEENREIQLTQQFLWVHNYVVKEKKEKNGKKNKDQG